MSKLDETKLNIRKITPHLWFEDNAEEAAKFYTSIFKNSRILDITHYGESAAEVSGRQKGTVMTVTFEIEGQQFLALNGGPIFKYQGTTQSTHMPTPPTTGDNNTPSKHNKGSGGTTAELPLTGGSTSSSKHHKGTDTLTPPPLTTDQGTQ
jgi:3-demethylubiquinone-9 3-methyltransferase